MKFPFHPTLNVGNIPVHQVSLQKYLGIFLDCKLNFEEHLKTISKKINKTIGLLLKFRNFLPRKLLLVIHCLRPKLQCFFPSKTEITSIRRCL